MAFREIRVIVKNTAELTCCETFITKCCLGKLSFFVTFIAPQLGWEKMARVLPLIISKARFFQIIKAFQNIFRLLFRYYIR